MAPHIPKKSVGKQPAITTAFKKRGSSRRLVLESSESESDAEDTEFVPNPVPVRRGRPPKQAAPEVEPLFSDDHPEETFSMYISKSKMHIPMVYFHSVCDWLDEHATFHDTSTEKGAKEELLHLQSVWAGKVLTDVASLKRLSTEVKSIIGVRWAWGDKSTLT